jgi:NADPH:quinone reductase-like Zn-dependent oxidoreductase
VQLRDAHVVGSCCARSAELVRGLGAEPWDYTAGASGLRDAFGASDNTKFDFVLDLIGGAEPASSARDACTALTLGFAACAGELLQAAMQTLKFGGAVVHVMNRGTDADFVKRQEAASRDGSGPRRVGCATPVCLLHPLLTLAARMRHARTASRWHTILVQPNGAQLEQIAELFEQGKLKLNVACVMPLEDVAKAHQLVESGHAGGKVVLKVT